MSVVSEHNEFISTKQNNEVEDYLIRIIKRYFEIHEDYTRNEMEAIVQESFTRLKRWMLRHRQFIFSLNQETGHLVLDISFFNGEPEITEKKTAFNKDFGEEEDTVCEGNDPRLYDMRIPLKHTHNLSDIPGLRDVIGLLNETRFPDIHGHNNLSVLNCITYTGSNMLIDLIMIEEVLNNIEDYRNRLQEKGNYALFEHNKYLREYDLKLGIVQEYFENIATDITQRALSWTEDAEIYINQTIKPDPILEPIGAFKQAYMLNKVQKVFGKMDKILYTDRVPIPVSTVKSEVKLIFPDDYTYDEDVLPTEGSTVIGNISDDRILVSVQTGPGITKYTDNLKSSHTNSDGDIDSTRISLSFEYEDEDGYTHVFPLPFRYTTEDNYEVCIRGRYNKLTGEIEARASMVKHIPFLCNFPYPLYYEEVNDFDRDVYVPIFLTEDSDIVKTRKTLEKYGCDIPILNQILHRDLAQYMETAYNDGNVEWITTDYYIGGIHNGIEYVEGFEDNSPAITYYNEIDPDEADKPAFGGNVTITFNDDGSSNIKALFAEENLESHGFILHYKDKLLTDYFKNPRIRYDIMGNDIS